MSLVCPRTPSVADRGTSSLLVYTAVQIAAATKRTKRGVLKALEKVPPAEQLAQRGGKAAAWRLDQLPALWRDALAASAAAQGYRGSAHLLSDPGVPWQPEIGGAMVKLSDLAEHCITFAQRLQRALLPSLHRLTCVPPAAPSEALASGLAEYRAVFGHGVSAAHWRRLVNRTVDRAGSAGDFTRVEIFLNDKLARRPQIAPGYVAAGMHLQNLRRALSAVGRPTEPTADEQMFIWSQACDEWRWLVEEGTSKKAAERAVFTALDGSGVRLARSTDALKKNFARKLARWQAGGGKPSALHDGRRVERHDVRLALPDADRQTLIARAVERGGRISQAFKEVREQGELSPEIAARYIANPASKSYVPRSVRAAIKHDVAQLEDLHHGPRQAKLKGAWIPRDYSDIRPNDWHQGDDCTLPIYYRELTPEGVRAFRGQFLVQVDVKTGCVLGFALHSQEQYNARIIRTLILRVHDSYGFPNDGWYFEGNLWKRSRILKGRPADSINLEETELGLREYDLRFIHAKLPRAKIVERVLGTIQNEAEPLPGYCGRDEKTDKYERLQKQLLAAAAGRIEYASFLMDKSEWIGRLEAICERYNAEAQEGRLKGVSPLEAYLEGFDYRKGALRLPDNARYLLANHRRVEKVSKNGIRLVIGGDAYYYRSAATGPLIGQRVFVWHDVEDAPDSITITDLQRQHPVEVPRVTPVPSMTATREQLGEAMRQVAAHGAYARTLYRIIRPRFQRNHFRRVWVDAATRELGEQIAAGRAEAGAEARRQRQVAGKVADAEREAGVQFAKPHRNLGRKLRGLEMLRRADELDQQEEGKA